MLVAIVGSRGYPDLAQVRAFVRALPVGTTIVSGGARGVDQEAVLAAAARGLKTIVFPANWEKYGKKAGFLRNAEIVALVDEIVAFWDSRSRGTADTIDRANKAGKPVRIFVNAQIDKPLRQAHIVKGL